MMIRRWVALAVAVASAASAGVTAAYGDSAAPPPSPEQVLGEVAPGPSEADSAPEPV
ncbi:peptidoglycan-binding protein, partial [Streptomyces sp. McG6]|nr:peptidoglycan-binding protein [Streptomyces sp. McG6]